MKRRNFLGLGILSLFSFDILNLNAEDFRKTKPDVWTSHTIDDAIQKLYGTTETIKDRVTLTIPDVAASGGAVPVDIQSEIPAKSVALFQSSNPESAVCAFTINENMIIDYSLKIKLKQDGIVTVIVEGIDGKLYSASKAITVALGGCEG